METKRLIDANEAFEIITDFAGQAENKSAYAAFWKAGNAIQKMPTVDAAEVVHSKWDTVFYERNGTLASYSHLCPECKYFYRDVRFKGHNYCPNCGARMDEGKDNETLQQLP